MRRLPALFLSVLLTVVLAPTAALAHGEAMADPDELTVGPNAPTATWEGQNYAAGGTFAAGCPGRDSDPSRTVCDYVTLQVTVDNAYWETHDGGIEVEITWPSDTNDFDLFVEDSEGNRVASAASTANPETLTINEPVGVYEIEVKPYTVADSGYSGVVTFTATETTAGNPLDEPVFEEALSDKPCIDGRSSNTFTCDGLDLAAFVPLATLGAADDGDEASDIWGWTNPETGAEIAIMGLTNGTTFVDVTDPLAPVVLGVLGNPSPTPSIWHDIKTLGDVAYIVSESNAHEMQIVDLSSLPEPGSDEAITTDGTVEFSGDAHNIVTNEDTGRIYSVGTNACDGGAVVYDVDIDGDGPDTGSSDPFNPTLLGCVLEDGYTHDAQCVVYEGPDADHTGKEICVNSNEDTLTVVDVTSVGSVGESTVQLSRTPYENAEYSHQGWLTEDQRYFLLGDELDEQGVGVPTTTYIWDMADLDAPVLLNNYEHDTASIDHNLYVKGDLVYQSNYTAGLRVQDLGRIGEGQLDEVAFFDTYPANDDATFNGTWSNYPYFDSGTIVVTGINEGLFVLTPSADDEPTDDEPTDEQTTPPTDVPTDPPSDDPAGDEPELLDGRVEGADRFATAAELSRRTFDPGVDVVYIATGRGFADALAGGALAAVNGAPILLVEPDSLPDATSSELLRLEPDEIVVLGGELAVSAGVRNQLTALTDGDVRRLAGPDRYATATVIAEAFPGDVDEVLVATGLDFPDALAGGGLAAARRAPILLTTPASLPEVVRTGLDRLDVTRATVLGGDAVVDESVVDELAELVDSAVPRLAGVDRFATMAAIVRAYDPTPKVVFVATGLNFPDALTATPVVAANDAALVLVRPDDIPAVAAELLADLDPERIVVVGGTQAVSDAVEAELRSSRR